jgi:hypothetical protein
MDKKNHLSNPKKANTKDGYYMAKRNTQGTEKTQIMEWLAVAHIDSLKTKVNSSDDAFVKIPISKLVEHGVVRAKTATRDISRLHKEMAKLMLEVETTRERANGDTGIVYTSTVVFPEMEYDHLDKEVTVKISSKAVPQFYNLSDLAHTSLNLDIVLKNITGFWARKIYAICREQLYHNSDIIEFKLSLNELYSVLGIEGKFKDTKDLNRRILSPSLWELGWDLKNQKHVSVSSPKKPVADIDLHIRASQIVSQNKIVGFRFQVRPKVMNQPSLIGRAPESITMPTREYLTSINWSQWNMINQLGETNGSLVVEKAIAYFRDNLAGNSKKNVAGLLNEHLPTLIENALNNQSKEEQQQQRNQRRIILLEEWRVSHPLEKWVEDRVLAMQEAGFEGAEIKNPKEQWLKAGETEVKKALDKEEYEQKQQRLF